MQQETPQVGPPTSPTPSLPPQTPPQGAPQQHGEQNFYHPAVTPSPTVPQGSATAPQPQHHGLDGTITWEASEYVHIDKGGMWLVGLLVVVLAIAGFAVWLGEWTFALLVIVMGVAMGVFAFRPPRVLHYTLTDQGVQIANKMYFFHDYRAFGVLEDGAFYTLTLIPVKRFSPALSVYFGEADGDRIVDMVGDHLPMEKIEPDLIDTIMRRLRF